MYPLNTEKALDGNLTSNLVGGGTRPHLKDLLA